MDGEAASIAVSQGLSPDGDKSTDPVREVGEQIVISIQTTLIQLVLKAKQVKHTIQSGNLFTTIKKWWLVWKKQISIWQLQTRQRKWRSGGIEESNNISGSISAAVVNGGVNLNKRNENKQRIQYTDL